VFKTLEARREYDRQYYHKNKEVKKEQNKRSHLKNKEARLKQKREYYHENREDILKSHRENPIRDMYGSAKKRAKEQGVNFNIDSKYLKEIWPKDNKCPVLGYIFKRGRGHPIPTSPTLDRLIPERGYVKGNVQVICNLANIIFSNALPDQVLAAAYHRKKTVDKASLEAIIEILKTIDERTIL